DRRRRMGSGGAARSSPRARHLPAGDRIRVRPGLHHAIGCNWCGALFVAARTRLPVVCARTARRRDAARQARRGIVKRAGARSAAVSMSLLRIAALASHPVQYQAPWYRALARICDLHVFFAHRVTPADQARAGFDVAFEWDVPLVEGYAHEWLPNLSARPGVDRFRGCD